MTLRQPFRYGQRRLVERAGRSIPYLGAAIALVTLGAAIRRKGIVRGTADSVINAIPFVGGAKILAETVRGREFIRDKATRLGQPDERVRKPA